MSLERLSGESQRASRVDEEDEEPQGRLDVRDQAIAELRETVSNLMAKNTKMAVELEAPRGARERNDFSA